nr:aminopeptidase [Lachnospiraceae bacterium]
MESKSVWKSYNARQLKECEEFNGKYKDFLNNGKTERECVNIIVDMAEEAGYVELSEKLKGRKGLKKGDKIYAVNMNKSV